DAPRHGVHEGGDARGGAGAEPRAGAAVHVPAGGGAEHPLRVPADAAAQRAADDRAGGGRPDAGGADPAAEGVPAVRGGGSAEGVGGVSLLSPRIEAGDFGDRRLVFRLFGRVRVAPGGLALFLVGHASLSVALAAPL